MGVLPAMLRLRAIWVWSDGKDEARSQPSVDRCHPPVGKADWLLLTRLQKWESAANVSMKHLPRLPHAEVDNGILASVRMPESEELQQLFACAYEGPSVGKFLSQRQWAWQRPWQSESSNPYPWRNLAKNVT